MVPLQVCQQQCLTAENSLLLKTLPVCDFMSSCSSASYPTPSPPQLTLLSLLCWTLLISPAFTYWRFPGLGLWTFPLHFYSLPKEGLPSPELDHPLHIVPSQTGTQASLTNPRLLYSAAYTSSQFGCRVNGSLRPNRPKVESGISPQTPQPPLPNPRRSTLIQTQWPPCSSSKCQARASLGLVHSLTPLA